MPLGFIALVAISKSIGSILNLQLKTIFATQLLFNANDRDRFKNISIIFQCLERVFFLFKASAIARHAGFL